MKRLIRIVAFAGATMLLSLCGWTAETSVPASGVTPEVETALLKEDWQKVAELLSDVTVRTSSPILRLIKGHACLAINQNNESVFLFSSVADASGRTSWAGWTEQLYLVHTNSLTAIYLSADGKARLRDHEAAASRLERVRDLNARHAMSLNALGMIRDVQGDFDAALIAWQTAVTVNPRLADAWCNLGQLAIEQKEGALGAFHDFNEALTNSADFAFALYGRGCIAMLQRRFPEARDDLRLAIERVGSETQAIAAALSRTDGLLEALRSEDVEGAKGDAENPQFAVKSSTLEKIRRGDVGFCGWALQNALINANSPAEVRVIKNAAQEGINKVGRADFAKAVGGDVKTSANWYQRQVDNTPVRSTQSRTEGGGLSAELDIKVAKLGGNNFSSTTMAHEYESTIKRGHNQEMYGAVRGALGQLKDHQGNSNPQGFKTDMDEVLRDTGDWPFLALYGLGYGPVEHANGTDKE